MTGNQVTINATAKTPYVIYKGDANVGETDSLTTYDWGEGGLVKDPGFDSFTPSYGWQVSNAEFWNNDHENTYLVMNGQQDGSATQTITGLTPGQHYQASVWAEVQDKTATIRVSADGQELASNYMTESNVIYGIHHTDKYKRYLQRIWVEFTAPENGTVELSLTATNGMNTNAYAHFDDVRIVAHDVPNLNGHDFYEDFENTTEGYGIFVATESDNSHLAETNDPYTFDTIDGKFSLKTRAGDYFRTLPHTLRLQPNTRYTLGLEYISGNAGNVFTVSVKSDKAQQASDTTYATVATQTCVGQSNWQPNTPLALDFTTGSYDDYYVEIVKAGSISEYSIDNFYVDEVELASIESLKKLCEECRALTETDYTPESWAAMQKKLSAAENVLTKSDPAQDELQVAQDELEAAKDALVAYAKQEDLDQLQGVIQDMQELTLEFYKDDEQWAAFQAKIAEAEELLVSEKPTLLEVDAMIQALQDAKANLNSLIDKSELQKLYDFCAAIPSNDVMDGNEAVIFLRERSNADTILKNDTATQDVVDEMLATLESAYAAIIPKRTTNEGHMDAAIVVELAEKLEQAKQVAEPSAELAEAIALAEAASEAMSTWKSVVEAIDALEAAMPGQPPKMVSVSFDTMGGSQIAPITVESGSYITQPPVPSRSGYTFTGWYLDAGYTQKFDFGTAITKDLTLYAQWTASDVTTYTVTFESNGGTAVTPQTVEENGLAVEPAVPSRDGYVFNGWYLDAACTQKFDFNTVITKDLTLYAGWKETDGGTSGDSGDGTISQNQTQTTTNADGSITTTVTKPDGTVTKTTVSTNGSKTVVETKPDGSTTTITRTDGASSVTTVDETGKWESEVKVPERVVNTAQENGENVTLPLPGVPNTSDRDRAPTITVQLPEGDGVMVEIPVDEATSGTVAVLVNQDGTEEVIKTTVTTENGVTVTLTDGQRVKIVDNSKYFSDVPDGYWGEQSIDFVASREIFGGTGPNLFSPELAMTRGMMVTVLARMEGVDTSTGSVWYEAGQKWAMANGISDGTNMEQGLTREQLALMLYRYAGMPNVNGDLNGFSDGDSVSSWAVAGMKWAVQEGLISGMGNNMLNPQGQASRAQVATLLMRFIANGLM